MIAFHEPDSSSADAALEALPRPIVHFKGFASRLVLQGAVKPPMTFEGLEEETEKYAEVLLSMIAASSARTLLWDGDDLSEV